MMDEYHSIHGHDISSFDSPGTHRLPTVAASQALDELKHDLSSHISTGLNDLDKAFLSGGSVDSQEGIRHGGVKRGQVTEVWGPPGTGRTALGIQLTANALCDGNGVVWIDCFQNVQTGRVSKVIDAVQVARLISTKEIPNVDLSKFTHYSCMTLPHLMALITRPTAKSISTGVSLIVISSMTALINAALPKPHDRGAGNKPNKGPTPLAKRLQGLQCIMSALQKLAAIRNCAVVVLSQCATKMQAEQGPTLIPAVNATVWEQGVSSRLVLFRDWTWQSNKPASVFMAGLQKLDGKATNEAVEQVSAFKVDQNGISSVDYDATGPSIQVANMSRPKRKLGQTELEVPDSDDDEDYGWADEDEAAMPAPPPQWQGSEDVILGQDVGRSEDENTDDDEDRSNDEATTLYGEE